jgi:predicted lysophospholipase L1 biosynthesis ABC-type transport system permease subunit
VLVVVDDAGVVVVLVVVEVSGVVVLVVVDVSGVIVVIVVDASGVVVVEGAVMIVLVVDGSVVVVLVVSTTQEPRSSGTSARIGIGALSTPSKVTVTESSSTAFSTMPLAPLCEAFPVANVMLRPGCDDRSRATPSS